MSIIRGAFQHFLGREDLFLRRDFGAAGAAPTGALLDENNDALLDENDDFLLDENG